MLSNLFVDLDGTLIDSKGRQYALFRELLELECPLSFSDYWRLKRSGATQKDILVNNFGYSREGVETFKKRWMTSVEDVKRLRTDTVIPGIPTALGALSNSFSVYLVTARQHQTALCEQLEWLGLYKFFREILCTGQQLSKSELVQSRVSASDGDIFIGDTGEDIVAGKSLGITSVAVLTGVCSRALLEPYSPDFILDSFSNLEDIVAQVLR